MAREKSCRKFPPSSNSKIDKHRLHHDRHRRRVKARMHFGQSSKKISIASHREGHARSAHDGAVQRDQHRERHARRDNAGAHASHHQRDGIRCGTRRSGDRTGGQHILHARIDQHVKHAHGGHARDQRNRNIALRIASPPRHHVQIVPSVIGPECGDQRGHEAGDSAFGAREGAGKVAPPRPRRCRIR